MAGMIPFLSVLAGATLVAGAVRWLTSRRSLSARWVGRRIAALAAAWSAWVVFICIADSGLELTAREVLVILDVALVGAMSIWAVTRGRWSLS
jgi:hypothetical protein